MSTDAPVIDARVLDRLLADVVDTRDKLDVLVCLRRSSTELTTVTIAAHVGLPWVAVAEALGGLQRSGVVSTVNEDGAGWWLDELSAWSKVIDVLVRFYQRDRKIVLRRMASVALQRSRAVGHTEVPHVIRLRFKYEP